MGSRGSGSGKSSGKSSGGEKYRDSSGKSIRVVNLKRDTLWKQSKTVQKYMNESNTIMYHTKTGIIEFYKQEGLIGVAKNVDNMNMRNVAKNYNKSYIEV